MKNNSDYEGGYNMVNGGIMKLLKVQLMLPHILLSAKILAVKSRL